eukprot:2137752-Prymnesium_polylepis.1
MSGSISNPFAVASTVPEWQVRIGTSWKDIDKRSAATMETAFKGSSKTIKIGPSSVLPHTGNFYVEAMSWDGMSVRRATARKQGAPITPDALMNEQLFSYWDDD